MKPEIFREIKVNFTHQVCTAYGFISLKHQILVPILDPGVARFFLQIINLSRVPPRPAGLSIK